MAPVGGAALATVPAWGTTDPERSLYLLAVALVAAGLVYLAAMLLLSRVHRPPRRVAPAGLLHVFVLPCLNEEAVIGASLRRLLQPGRRDFRVLVVDDGSDDRTSQIVETVADYRVWLLRRDPPYARAGKGAALNAAIAHLLRRPEIYGRHPDRVIIVVVDADGRLDPHAIDAAAPYFADPRTGALQIGVRINNRTRSLLARMQDMEFVIYTEVFQRGRRHIGNVGLGGNGQFVRLSALLSLGPAPWTHSLTEDLDLGVRLLLAGWKNEFCPHADVHQQGVVRLRRLLRQRTRWFQGHLQCWRLVPRILRGARLRALPDMLFHLSSPVLILFASLLSASFLLATAADLVRWSAGRGAPEPGWFVAAYLLTVCPALLCGLVYLRRERLGWLGPLRLAAYVHLYVLYGAVWFVAGWWAVGRVLAGRTNWHKTDRTPEPAPTAPVQVAAAAPARPSHLAEAPWP
jgi:cellulose synthase/poly-beta-1,6-N-acetylglucosamine synthase-like glycosyltransferase